MMMFLFMKNFVQRLKTFVQPVYYLSANSKSLHKACIKSKKFLMNQYLG